MEPQARSAILLIGPTGSGKTPLGQLLEARGLKGRKCHHFDFGAELRGAAAAPEKFAVLRSADLEVVRRSLVAGALLKNSEFSVALKIFEAFIERRSPGTDDILVLNGLPRHEGQASAMSSLIRVESLIILEAGQDVVMERLRLDTGGDRKGRTDDEAETVRRKLEAYREQTLPLLRYYEAAGARLVKMIVSAAMTAEDMWQDLEKVL